MSFFSCGGGRWVWGGGGDGVFLKSEGAGGNRKKGRDDLQRKGIRSPKKLCTSNLHSYHALYSVIIK